MKKIKDVRNIRFNVFPDKRSQNRFRVITNGGKVLAKSAKGYQQRGHDSQRIHPLTGRVAGPPMSVALTQ